MSTQTHANASVTREPLSAEGFPLPTLQQAADVLAVISQRLRGMAERGEVRFFRNGQELYFDINDLLRVIADTEQGGSL